MGLHRLLFLKQLISKSTLESLHKPTSLSIFGFDLIRRTNQNHYHSTLQAFNERLHSKLTLFVAGSPETTVIPFLNQWVEEGNQVRESELQRIVRTLRSKKRFARALEVSEWMNSRRGDHFAAGDLAVQLDLIGKVHGVDAAEKYFNELNNHSDKIYGALLNCYVREGLVDKALPHFKKMKDMGIARNSITYNSIMNLYVNIGQVEKIPEVLSEMQDNGVSPDNVSYRLCIKSYALRSDLTSIEKVLQEMESRQGISMDWTTYSTVASCYIQGGLNERAKYYLLKAEDKVNADAVGYNNLITIYASLGDVSQVMRLWQKQKNACRKRINIDYMTMLGSLVKLGELEEAERIFKDWQSNAMFYDFRVPNVLLIGYTQHGQVDKAERMLASIIGEGKTPIPNCWSIITSGHIKNQNMEKAVQCMKKALELAPKHKGWEPKPALISSILNWLAENADIEQVEAFVDLLGKVVPMNQAMYHSLLKASIRHGREVDGILKRMKADNIDVDEETNKLLGSR